MPLPPHREPPGALHTNEFERADNVARLATKHLGRLGRCYGSKSRYWEQNPENLVIMNANVCTREEGKLWWGDLDVTHLAAEVRALARQLGARVFVMPENAARFQTADNPRFEEAVYDTDGTDEGVTPTLEWYRAAVERRRVEEERRPGRLSLTYAPDGTYWELVDANGEPRRITAAEARAEFRARGWTWQIALETEERVPQTRRSDAGFQPDR